VVLARSALVGELLGASSDLGHPHVERRGDALDGSPRRVGPSALDVRDGGGVHVGRVRELLLRESARVAKLPDRPNGRFFYLEDGARTAHPDWMAAIRIELPPELELEEGDF
jgi:hypothetical protein